MRQSLITFKNILIHFRNINDFVDTKTQQKKREEVLEKTQQRL